MNVRTTAREDEDWLRQELEQLRLSLQDGSRYRVELTGQFTAPPKMMSPEISWLITLAQRAATQIGIDLNAKPTGGTCDGNRLAQYGLPNLDNPEPAVERFIARTGSIPESLVERSLLLFTILQMLNQELR